MPFGKADRELLVRVRADINDAKRGMREMRDEIARTEGEAGKASSRGMSRLTRAFGFLTAAAAAYVALRLSQEIIRQGDAYQVLTTRIQTAAKGLGDHVQIQRELEEISRRNGVALENTVSLFQNLARTAPELGASAQDILKLTNAVQQLGVISGAAPANLSAGLQQFSQAMASGIVRAEEMNSLLENIPEVANRIAKGMGLTVGQLRKAVLEGKVLSKDVYDALLKQAPEIAEQFKDMPDTVARSGTALGVAWERTLGVLDRLIGGTSKLAGLFRSIETFLTRFADRLDQPVNPTATDRITQQIDEYVQRRQEAEQALRDLTGRGRGPFQSQADFNAEKKALQDRIAALNRFIVLYSERANEIAKLDLERGAIERPGETTPPKADPSDEEKKRQEAIEKTITALQQEAAEFGLTAEQIVVYRLQQLGATEAEIELARRAAQAGEAMRARQEDYKKAAAIIEETRTESEKFIATSQELFRLYDAGHFGVVGSAEALETLRRAMINAAEGAKTVKGEIQSIETSGNETFRELTVAVHGWGEDFTNTLADAVLEGKLQFADLTEAILRDLLRIMIQAQITLPLLQAAVSLVPVGGTTVSVAAASGGLISGPGTATSDSIPGWLSNGEYVVRAAAVQRYGEGFLAAINQMRLPKFAHGGLVRGFARPARFAEGGMVSAGGGGNSGAVEVRIDNRGQPARVSSSEASFEGDKLVVRVLLEDLASGGPYSREVANVFGLRRGR